MGASFARQWANLGYYPDLLVGYISNAGGYPVFVLYPEELLNVPRKCTCCGESSWLKRDLMFKVLCRYRTMFAEYVDFVVAKRVAYGDPNPFHGFKTAKGKRRKKIAQQLKSRTKSFKNDSPSQLPPPPDAETLKTDFGFELPIYIPVKPSQVVVCGYCGKGFSPQRRARILLKRENEIAKLKAELARSKP